MDLLGMLVLIFKVAEAVMTFIVMMITRLGGRCILDDGCIIGMDPTVADPQKVPGSIHFFGMTKVPGSGENMPNYYHPDFTPFGFMVVYGFFYFSLILVVGVALGERFPITNFFHALCGFFFYLALGGAQAVGAKKAKDLGLADKLVAVACKTPGPICEIAKMKADASAEVEKMIYAMVAMAILTGLVFLAEAIYTAFTVWKQRNAPVQGGQKRY